MNHDIQRLLSCRFVFKIKMPSDVRVQLINDLADIEYGPLLVHLVHLMIYVLVATGVKDWTYRNSYSKQHVKALKFLHSVYLNIVYIDLKLT